MRDLVKVLALLGLWGHAGAGSAFVRVPSDGAGPGGTICARIAWPDTSPHRFGPGGAPVIVVVPGTLDPGSFFDAALEAPFLAQGFVTVSFIFPGGTDSGHSSDGTYDQRGPNCRRALRDVARYAAGLTPDHKGLRLSSRVPGGTRERPLGLLGLSNGGMTSVNALALDAEGMPAFDWFVAWESPMSAQNLGLELPMWYLDPDPDVDADGDGVAMNDVRNGAYASYDFPGLQLDYSRIRFDPAVRIDWSLIGLPHVHEGAFYFDNDADGVFTTLVPQSMLADVNLNGRIDPTEDFVLIGMPVSGGAVPMKGMLSPAAGAAAQAAMGATPWPAHYFTAAESAAFWPERDATLQFPAALAAQPAMRGMAVFFRSDHAQHSHDHAHVLHCANGFASSSRWFRLNPDRSYVESVAGVATPSYRDTDANLPATPGQMPSLAQPDGPFPGVLLTIAAACAEMADRSYHARWEPNLDSVLAGTASASPSWLALE